MKSIIQLLGLGAVAVSVLLAGCATNFNELDPLTLDRSDSFELDMDPDYALPLFTAPGEKLWISSWDPIILEGDGFAKGTTWVTTNHGSTAYWYVTDYDTKTRHAQYMRVTPGENTGTVDVSVAPNGKGGSTISVTYRLTGLSESGNKNMETFFEENNYASMMLEWQSMINDSREKIDAHYK